MVWRQIYQFIKWIFPFPSPIFGHFSHFLKVGNTSWRCFETLKKTSKIAPNWVENWKRFSFIGKGPKTKYSKSVYRSITIPNTFAFIASVTSSIGVSLKGRTSFSMLSHCWAHIFPSKWAGIYPLLLILAPCKWIIMVSWVWVPEILGMEGLWSAGLPR